MENMFIDLDNINFDDIELGASIATDIAEEITENKDTFAVDINKNLEIDEQATFLPPIEEFLNESPIIEEKIECKAVSDKKEKEVKITGPRIIKAFGEELYTEYDVSVSNEDIRKRLVNEFGLGEFSKASEVIFDYYPKLNILDVRKGFKKKG